MVEIWDGGVVPFSRAGYPVMFLAGRNILCAECAGIILDRAGHGLKSKEVREGSRTCSACKAQVYAVDPDPDLEEEEEGAGMPVWRLAVGTYHEVFTANNLSLADPTNSDWEELRSDWEEEEEGAGMTGWNTSDPTTWPRILAMDCYFPTTWGNWRTQNNWQVYPALFPKGPDFSAQWHKASAYAVDRTDSDWEDLGEDWEEEEEGADIRRNFTFSQDRFVPEFQKYFQDTDPTCPDWEGGENDPPPVQSFDLEGFPLSPQDVTSV